MKSLVLYDSLYGNTAQVARVIADILAGQGPATLLSVADARLEQLAGLDLLVAGSPTQRFRPTQALSKFIDSLPRNSLKGLRVAAFDTRLTAEEIEKSPPLPFFVKMFGFAAGRIAKGLRSKGGQLVILPEGFYVLGMQGPLMEGELERAAAWAGKLSVIEGQSPTG